MFQKRSLAALAAFLVVCTASAVTLPERSPFFQGHWWNPGYSGHGFEIFNASDQVMVIWYTYDDVGKPIWYTAQGPRSELGTKPWALQRHQWANGRISQSTTVGSLQLNVRHPEQVEVAFSFGTRGSASWVLMPFLASSVVNEVDHTGHWFDPTQSGWGFTLTEQGDTLGSVLYAYDTGGAPTWLAGFDRGKGRSVEFFSTTGNCPLCVYNGVTSRSIGTATFEYQGESELVVRAPYLITQMLAVDVRFDGARARQLGRPASMRAADRQLANFTDAASLKAFLDAGMMSIPLVGGGIDFSAPPPQATYSPTNLQEQNVDEADIAKTDGRYAYTFQHAQYGNRLPALRYARIGDGGTTIAVKGTIPLQSAPTTPLGFAGLFQTDTRVVAVTGSVASGGADPWLASHAWTRGQTYVEVFDVSSPDSPVSRWHALFDGHVIGTRRIGDMLYLVTRFTPYVAGFAYGTTYAPSVEANRQLLAATPLEGLMPKVSLNGAAPASLLDPTAVFVPPVGARKPVADLIVVTAIDLAQPRIAQSMAVAGVAETLYVSSENLYLATSRYERRDEYGGRPLAEPSLYLTDLHRIRIASTGMTVSGSGTVEGHLGWDTEKTPLRLSEHNGRLRAVTSSWSMWAGTQNRVTVLEPSTVSPGVLKTLAWLPNAARPEPLGKMNEDLYATRFVGDRLYAVTFLRTDPLYVVDLANPADPRISGALEVPGFSEYLHPLPGNMLLGFGRDATSTGFALGLQLSLYDVGDAGKPVEVQRFALGARGSASALLGNHHAFSALLRADGTGSVGFPARIHSGPPNASGDSPWSFSGVLRFQLQTGGPGLRLFPSQFLVSHDASNPPSALYDPALNSGRSILFPSATVYVGEGQFWVQDASGQTKGPY